MSDEYVFPKDKVVIYAGENGVAAILAPVPDCGLTLEEIIEKDIPKDTPYEIIDRGELPDDRTFRNAWEFSE